MQQQVPKNPDVVIVGAGVLGLTLAYQLSQRDCSVVLIEKELTFAKHASGNNAGMFRQLYRHPKLTEWAERSKNAWPEDVKRTAFEQTGSLVIGRALPAHHKHLFEQKAIRARYGNSYTTVPAIYTESDGLIDPIEYNRAIYREIDSRKVSFLFDTRCDSIEQQEDNSWLVSCADGSKFESMWVVNAAGAWVNSILKKKASEASVAAVPYARHLFNVRGLRQSVLPTSDVGFYWEEIADWYMRRIDGNEQMVSVCDQLAADPDNFTPDPKIFARVREKLDISLPKLGPDYDVSSLRHCFRTYTEDKLPIWGEDPQFSGLFWLGAFGGLGMSTSFAATEDAAKYVLGEGVSVEADFSPERARLKDDQPILQLLANVA